ncbi:growth factor receptor-bound protein 7 isoform X4 [Apteryx mantelli]|uniref:Growth factor receptor-bound protein 7 isoform X4 n=1 Tax=Apteryx mantelli TaxID=2696672 RepID=A0ABM4FTA2_9AVES
MPWTGGLSRAAPRSPPGRAARSGRGPPAHPTGPASAPASGTRARGRPPPTSSAPSPSSSTPAGGEGVQRGRRVPLAGGVGGHHGAAALRDAGAAGARAARPQLGPGGAAPAPGPGAVPGGPRVGGGGAGHLAPGRRQPLRLPQELRQVRALQEQRAVPLPRGDGVQLPGGQQEHGALGAHPELPQLRQLPRGPGLPAPAGGRPQGLEALLLLPAPLGALLLHQGHVQGPPAPAVPRRPHRVQHLLRDAGQEALRDAHRVRLLHQALQGAERHEGPEAPVQRGRAEPDVLDGGFPPLQVRHAALPQLPAGAGPAQPAPLDRPHAPAERVGQRAGGHGLLGVHGPGDREPQRGADGRPGGGAGLEEEDDAPVQPAGRLPELPAQRRHPPHPALVPRAHLPRGHPAAHRPAGPGGWRLPGAGEPAQPQGLRAVPVPPAEGQALSHPAERGGGPALLHHGRRADPLRRPHPAGGVSPDQPGHPALQAPALLHLRGPLSPARHRTAGTARGQHGTVLHGPARHDGAQPVRHSQHGLVQPAWPSWHGPAQHSQHSRCSQHGTVLHGTTGHSLAQPVRHSLVQPARPARHGWARSCTAQPGMVLHSATGHSWCSTAGTAGTAGTALRSAAWPELGRPLGGGSGGAGTGTRQGAPSQAAPPPVPFPCAQPGSAAGAGTPPGPPHSRTFRPGPPQRRPPALLARHGGARPCG